MMRHKLQQQEKRAYHHEYYKNLIIIIVARSMRTVLSQAREQVQQQDTLLHHGGCLDDPIQTFHFWIFSSTNDIHYFPNQTLIALLHIIILFNSHRITKKRLHCLISVYSHDQISSLTHTTSKNLTSRVVTETAINPVILLPDVNHPRAVAWLLLRISQ